MPVVDYYRKQDRVVEVSRSYDRYGSSVHTECQFFSKVNSEQEVAKVTEDIRKAVNETFAKLGQEP